MLQGKRIDPRSVIGQNLICSYTHFSLSVWHIDAVGAVWLSLSFFKLYLNSLSLESIQCNGRKFNATQLTQHTRRKNRHRCYSCVLAVASLTSAAFVAFVALFLASVASKNYAKALCSVRCVEWKLGFRLPIQRIESSDWRKEYRQSGVQSAMYVLSGRLLRYHYTTRTFAISKKQIASDPHDCRLSYSIVRDIGADRRCRCRSTARLNDILCITCDRVRFSVWNTLPKWFSVWDMFST